MPYIALQLIGMEVAIKALGLHGELPLIVAFLVLALYTYSSGLRAPALIAFVKDIMIYIVVLVAVAIVPSKLGGYGAVFDAADAAFKAKGSGGILLSPAQILPYASLALGSALAAFMYPHTLTGIFASSGGNTIRKNAMLLPAYTLLLGLLAMLGYMGHAAGLKVTSNNDVVPALFKTLFPSWFAGFAFAAIAIGALVPAAVMSHRRGQPVHAQFLEGLRQPERHAGGRGAGRQDHLHAGQGRRAARHPAHADAVRPRSAAARRPVDPADPAGAGLRPLSDWFSRTALLAGWAVGLAGGSWLAWSDGLKPLHGIDFGDAKVAIYTGLLALALNIVVAVVVNLVLKGLPQARVSREAA